MLFALDFGRFVWCCYSRQRSYYYKGSKSQPLTSFTSS